MTLDPLESSFAGDIRRFWFLMGSILDSTFRNNKKMLLVKGSSKKLGGRIDAYRT